MKRFFLLVMCVCFSLWGMAQPWTALATSSHRIDKNEVGELRFEIDNISFFRDNEYSSSLTKGYSLPGLWLQPKLTYAPLSKIKLELGLHALIFNGANKYPCYVYHDIGTWKGSQYQDGAHLLPWFRAQAEFQHVSIVLGDIFGGENHGLGEVLWNHETNLSQDPEMGVQLLWDRPHLHADTWVNWQSYIFEEATHQEAFTVGSCWDIQYGQEEKNTRWSTPVQLLIQHRGGEQDTTAMGVQTICNFSLGERMRWNAQRKHLHHVTAEANLLVCYQQSGHLWPFDKGLAYHAAAEANLWDKLSFQGGVAHMPHHFVSLYGNPFFTTLSQKNGQSYRKLTTAYVRTFYSHTFAKHYTLGAEAEAYQCWFAGKSEFNFSFGIYLRLNPTFLLKRW